MSVLALRIWVFILCRYLFWCTWNNSKCCWNISI